MNVERKREIGLRTREAFDVHVTQFSQKKLHPDGCDSVVASVDYGKNSFCNHGRGGAIRLQSRPEFLPMLQPLTKTEHTVHEITPSEYNFANSV